MRVGKTRKVTELGRLVTRGQLQSVVNQIGQQLAQAMEKALADHEERLRAIESRYVLKLDNPDDPEPDIMPPVASLGMAERVGGDKEESDTKPTVLAHYTTASVEWTG